MNQFINKLRSTPGLSISLIFITCAIWLIWALPALNWDAAISQYYYDPAQGVFPLRNHVVLEGWLHGVLRRVLWLSPVIVLGFLLLSVHKQGWSLQSKQLLWLLLAQLAAPLVVSYLKKHTSPICPWDSLEYGGSLAHPAFSFVTSKLAGNCFPAGHPSGGWALIAYAYFWRVSNPKRANMALLAALALGALMAWVQIARGAHLLSHVLWTLWVCWLVIALMYWAAWPRAKPNTITAGEGL